jgi:[acyl-carrier-protein] S-malonyltransferase
MLLITAPGQGAQSPGFLSAWLELPGYAERLAAWSDLAGCDLIRFGTTAGAEEIRDTAIAQPLLVAAAIATADELFGGLAGARHRAGGVAGHSVGELAAGAIASAISPADAMRLTGIRGRAMAKAAAVTDTGMTAVLGGTEKDVLASLAAHGLTPANVNAAGQVVAAGTLAELEAFAADPPPGARLRPLAVAGAFHTRHMEPAVAELREAAAEMAVHDPALPLLSNKDGAVVRTGADWIDRIVNQVSAPVRWDKCMATMSGLGVSGLIELPPAGTLTGLARRALPGVQLLALKTPGDLAAARQMITEHGPSDEDSHAPGWRLLVAPSPGKFLAAAAGAAPGDQVDRGTDLGHVDTRGTAHPVSPGFPAVIIEWLVEDGDPVSAGQPLVRLQPGTSQ